MSPGASLVPKPPPTEAELARKAEARAIAKRFPYAVKIAKAASANRITPRKAEDLLSIVEELRSAESVDELRNLGFRVPSHDDEDWQNNLVDALSSLEYLVEAEDAEEREDASDQSSSYLEDLQRYFIEPIGD